MTVLKAGGEMVAVTVPRTIGNALREVRGLMYEEGRGTWFSSRYTLDPPQEYRVLFNYDRDPNWSPGIAPSAWAADLEHFPRDAEHVPDWLRARLAEPPAEY